MEKTTYRATLEYIINNCDLPKEHTENAKKLLESLSRKRTVDKAKEAEKQAIIAIARAGMTADWHTITEWLGIIDFPVGTTNQKLTSYFKDMIDAGEVEKTINKGRSLYRKVV